MRPLNLKRRSKHYTSDNRLNLRNSVRHLGRSRNVHLVARDNRMYPRKSVRRLIVTGVGTGKTSRQSSQPEKVCATLEYNIPLFDYIRRQSSQPEKVCAIMHRWCRECDPATQQSSISKKVCATFSGGQNRLEGDNRLCLRKSVRQLTEFCYRFRAVAGKIIKPTPKKNAQRHYSW